ncbi:MAG: hydantoinase B/oxoprolinase family protein [Solirubrobacterales bacterium]
MQTRLDARSSTTTSLTPPSSTTTLPRQHPHRRLHRAGPGLLGGAPHSLPARRPTRPTAATPTRAPTCPTRPTSTTRAGPRFPCVRIQRDRTDVADIIRMCRRRIRVPDMWYGDYLAMIGAARIGERRIGELVERYGIETIERFAVEWLDYSERRIAHEIAKLPKAKLQGTSSHDPMPGVPDGVPVDVDPDEGGSRSTCATTSTASPPASTSRGARRWAAPTSVSSTASTPTSPTTPGPFAASMS